MKSVRNDDSVRPKMTELPRARQNSSDSVTGNMPNMVQSDVMNMASSLDFPASETESSKAMPLFRLSSILSTRMMEFLTTMPNRAKIPMRPGKPSDTSNTAIPRNTPIRASGIGTRTINAFLNELNCMTNVAM